MINRKSSLFQELTEQELKAILMESLGPGEMEPPRLLEGGLFNTTYLVSRTDPPGKYVLRMGPVNRHLVLPYERKLMQAEQEAGCWPFMESPLPGLWPAIPAAG